MDSKSFEDSKYDKLKKDYDRLKKRYDKLNSRLDSIVKINDKTFKNFFEKHIDLERSNKRFETIIKQSDKQSKYFLELSDERERLLFEQAKLAALGEMIGNIAHQWKQPLSVITTSATGIKMQKEYGELSNEFLDNSLDGINDSALFLSQTIDTFQNFIKYNKNLQDVILQNELDNALEIINSSVSNNFIEIKKSIDYSKPIKYSLVTGELIQVVVNILNNAKDALLEKKPKEPWIHLALYKENEKIIIYIEDNAGGVPPQIINKIFNPYFTTKGKYKGTGIGLHMSKRIVQESLEGKLYVKNTIDGAKFFIELPEQLEI